MRDAAKAEFPAIRENRADSCKDPRARSECSAFPACLTRNRLFYRTRDFWVRGAFFNPRRWNIRPIGTIPRLACPDNGAY